MGLAQPSLRFGSFASVSRRDQRAWRAEKRSYSRRRRPRRVIKRFPAKLQRKISRRCFYSTVRRMAYRLTRRISELLWLERQFCWHAPCAGISLSARSNASRLRPANPELTEERLCLVEYSCGCWEYPSASFFFFGYSVSSASAKQTILNGHCPRMGIEPLDCRGRVRCDFSGGRDFLHYE